MSGTVSRFGPRLLVAVMLAAFAASGLAATSAQADAAVQRPIEDFVSMQGTYCWGVEPDCFLFVPPIKNFMGSGDGPRDRLISVDYAGLANAWIEEASEGAVSFGTETAGSITEKPLADGRAQVKVVLHTKNALTWVVDSTTGGFADGDLLFGNRAPDVLYDDMEPALGTAHWVIHFVNTAPGADMPDLIQLMFAPEEEQEVNGLWKMVSSADGPLHEAFGVPYGTPGRVTNVQTGLGQHMDRDDWFPAEFIKLKVVGK